MRPPGRSAAISRWRCRTTSFTARTRLSPRSARSRSGSVTEPDYVAVNREGWTRANKEYTDARAREAWAQDEITWGKWSLPESEVRALPEVTGKEIVELGCGTGYFGAWLKRLGASRVVGVDVTPAQLETAQRMNEEFGLGLEFLLENAEARRGRPAAPARRGADLLPRLDAADALCPRGGAGGRTARAPAEGAVSPGVVRQRPGRRVPPEHERDVCPASGECVRAARLPGVVRPRGRRRPRVLRHGSGRLGQALAGRGTLARP
ncbi:MAG: class I SAM-dependent methyltransferase [Actinobacteria bacterium]|nr:MAG: class I SAM-dependent methyltransferase [Actinomycetota bacterium]